MSAPPGRVRSASFRGVAGILVVAALSASASACAGRSSVLFDSGSTRTPFSETTAAATVPSAPPATPTASPEPPALPSSSDSREDVAVVIVSWGGGEGQVHASGIVPGRVESGGTCTLTATSAAGDVTSATRDAQPATDSTDCGVLSIPVRPGDWSLTLSYDAPGARGASDIETATSS